MYSELSTARGFALPAPLRHAGVTDSLETHLDAAPARLGCDSSVVSHHAAGGAADDLPDARHLHAGIHPFPLHRGDDRRCRQPRGVQLEDTRVAGAVGRVRLAPRPPSIGTRQRAIARVPPGRRRERDPARLAAELPWRVGSTPTWARAEPPRSATRRTGKELPAGRPRAAVLLPAGALGDRVAGPPAVLPESARRSTRRDVMLGAAHLAGAPARGAAPAGRRAVLPVRLARHHRPYLAAARTRPLHARGALVQLLATARAVLPAAIGQPGSRDPVGGRTARPSTSDLPRSTIARTVALRGAPGVPGERLPTARTDGLERGEARPLAADRPAVAIVRERDQAGRALEGLATADAGVRLPRPLRQPHAGRRTVGLLVMAQRLLAPRALADAAALGTPPGAGAGLRAEPSLSLPDAVGMHVEPSFAPFPLTGALDQGTPCSSKAGARAVRTPAPRNLPRTRLENSLAFRAGLSDRREARGALPRWSDLSTHGGIVAGSVTDSLET
jgi:hypothetical protein